MSKKALGPIWRRLLQVLAAAVLLGGAVLAAKLWLAGHLLINVTASIPRGLYWISTGQAPRAGDLVTFPIPESVRALVHARAYVPATIRLLSKPVVAVAGDQVCVRERQLFINGRVAANVPSADREGRRLPVDVTCGPLLPGQLYVATHHENSFDSRCFGPVAVKDVRGTLMPIWTF